MRRITWLLAPAAVALMIGGGQAKAGYTTLAVPGAPDTEAFGVSGNNVVGNYVSGDTHYGFLYNGTSYTMLAPAGTAPTNITGVSGNNVVGYYVENSGDYGFLYNGTTYTNIGVPGETFTVVTAISGSDVVGYYEPSRGPAVGFLYNGTTYTTLDQFPTAISGDEVVGYNSLGGWTYNVATGAYTTFAPPGATSGGVYATGVSGGNVVGYYYETGGPLSGTPSYGFLYNGTTYTTLAPPGATDTYAEAISGGNVVGYYETSAGRDYGFLYNLTTDTYTTLAPPGATDTYAEAISGGNVVGWYEGSGGDYAFEYQIVPEPSGLFLLGIGFATTAGYLGLRQRMRTSNAQQATQE